MGSGPSVPSRSAGSGSTTGSGADSVWEASDSGSAPTGSGGQPTGSSGQPTGVADVSAARPDGDALVPPGSLRASADEIEGEAAVEALEGGPVAPVAAAVTPPIERDWLSSICPYLQSEDGAYRSNEADPRHRCGAQDPPGDLPLAFQERFCLTERHQRCEMYKLAAEIDGAGAIPAEQLPAMAAAGGSSVSLALGSPGSVARRPVVIATAGIGALAIFVFAVALLAGSCSGEPASPPGAATAEPSPPADVSPAAVDEGQTPAFTPSASTPGPETTGEPEPTETQPLPDAVLYEIQEGEGLVMVAETFDITRRRLLRFNDQLEGVAPSDLPGQVIVVPVKETLTLEEIEALPGYRGPAP